MDNIAPITGLETDHVHPLRGYKAAWALVVAVFYRLQLLKREDQGRKKLGL